MVAVVPVSNLGHVDVDVSWRDGEQMVQESLHLCRNPLRCSRAFMASTKRKRHAQ